MPAVSKAQQRLMGAAEHGADFPMAKKVRGSMTLGQMHDFAVGPMTGKPGHVSQNKSSAPHPVRNLKHYAHPPKAR